MAVAEAGVTVDETMVRQSTADTAKLRHRMEIRPFVPYSSCYRLASWWQSTFATIVTLIGNAAPLPFRRTEMMLRHSHAASLSFVVLCCAATWSPTSLAQEWATLKGRIIVSGQVPEPEKLVVTRDEEVCGGNDLFDESLIVNSENRGLKNVVVWLSSKTQVPVHPSLQVPPEATRLDNKDCLFQPRIVLLRTNQILQSTNADSIPHNVAVYARRNQPFSIIVPEDKPLERTFPKEELVPIRVDCSIHAWMRAYLVITEHPYSAVTDENGSFSIPKLPQGSWQFRFWHERPGYVKQLQTAETTLELQRGTLNLDLASAETDLGELTISADHLSAD